MRKILVRIFNLVFLVAAAMSIVAFLTKPLVTLQVSVSIPATQIASMIPAEEEETPAKNYIMREESSEDEFSLSDLLTEENLASAGAGDLTLSFDIHVSPDNIKTYFDLENNYVILEKAVDEFLTKFIEDAYTYVSEIMVIVTKIVAKDVITDQVKQQIKDQLAKSGTAGDENEIFASSGCEEKVDKLVDKVVDEFAEGNVPIADLAATITDDEECGVKGILTSLKESNVPGFEDIDVNTVKAEDIQGPMTEALQSVPGLVEERTKLDANGNPVYDADGNEVKELIVTDIATALITIIENANKIGNETQSSGDPKADTTEVDQGEDSLHIIDSEPTGEEPKEETKALRIMRDEPGASETSKEEELKQKVTEFIKGLIPFDINNIDYSAGGIMPYVLLGVILLGIFPWALFAVFTIIRTIRKKKCWTKPWIVFVFACTQLVFGVIITLVFKFGTPLIMQVAGEQIPAEAQGLLAGLNVVFKTAAFVPSIIYLSMIPVSIVYLIIAHKVKKDFKQDKKDKKQSKKDKKHSKKNDDVVVEQAA